MSLSILNNISALQAENQLSITTAAANKSLQQLSSGSRINSGSDDAAWSRHLRWIERKRCRPQPVLAERDQRDRFVCRPLTALSRRSPLS